VPNVWLTSLCLYLCVCAWCVEYTLWWWRLWVVSLSRRQRKIAEKSVLMQTRPLLQRTNDFLLDGGIFFLFHLYNIIYYSLPSRVLSACPSVYSLIHFVYNSITYIAESGATRRLIYTSNPLQQKYSRTNPTGLMCLKYRGSGNCNRNLVRRSHTAVPHGTHTCIYIGTYYTHRKIQLAKNSLNTRSCH